MNRTAIVYSDAASQTVITWNYSATFNVHVRDRNGQWRNVDCFTCYDIDSIPAAQQVARDWAVQADEEYIAVMAEVAMCDD